MRADYERKPTGYRINPVIIDKVRLAAKMNNVSANDFVESILTKATAHIETDMEKEKRLKANREFLNRFAGKWKGNESSEEILDAIKASSSKEIISL